MKDLVEFIGIVVTLGFTVALTTLLLRFGWLTIDQYFGLLL